MTETPTYSIVVPVYNSAQTLAELCERLNAVFIALQQSFEIILVNDCSQDESWAAIKMLKAEALYSITAIHLTKNAGQHKAILCGFQFAKGKYIVTIDDDLQYFPEDIPLLINKMETTNADLVYGIFSDKKHSLLRNIGSKVVAKIFKDYASTPGSGSSFKLVRSNIIDAIKDYTHSYTYLDELISWHTTNVQFAEVRHIARREGKSGYDLWKLVKMTLQIIVAYTTLPLRFITYFGLISFLICLVLVSYFIWMKLAYGAQLGFTALIVSIFLSTGLILFCLGIIGDYLSRLFMLQNKRPPFLIKEVLR